MKIVKHIKRKMLKLFFITIFFNITSFEIFKFFFFFFSFLFYYIFYMILIKMKRINQIQNLLNKIKSHYSSIIFEDFSHKFNIINL